MHRLASPIATLSFLAVFTVACGASKKQPATTPPPGDATDAGTMPPPQTMPCDDASIAMCFAAQKACSTASGMPACIDCTSGQYASKTGACEAIAGTPSTHDFAMFTTMPGQEILGECQSWTLNNDTELWVNAVELTQDAASHHSNWTFVPDDTFVGPDGVWKCSERSYDQLSAALAGGVLYAQSTQAKHEVQKFPDGAAVRIPPYSRIIGDVHILNTTTMTVTGHSRLTLYALSAADVKVKLAPFHLTYDGLNIPPHATSRFTGNCSLTMGYKNAGMSGFDTNIYFILPHTHSLATRFFVNMKGGPMDGEKLLEIGPYNTDPHGRAFDPPLSTQGADGLTFGCEYANPRDVAVRWGFGDQEMCELLGFSDSPVAFESSVDAANGAGTDGSTQLFTAPCSSLVFQWDFKKPGGPGPM